MWHASKHGKCALWFTWVYSLLLFLYIVVIKIKNMNLYLYGPMADGAFAVWIILLTIPAISVIVIVSISMHELEKSTKGK